MGSRPQNLGGGNAPAARTRRGRNVNRQQPAAVPAASGPLSQFAGPGGTFGGAAYARARQSGMSEADIRSGLTGSNLNVGSGVTAALNPGQVDKGWSAENASDLIRRGYYGGGLPSQDGNSYKLESYVLPFAHPSGLGEQKNVLFMADPGNAGNTYEERLNWMTENFGPGGRYGDKSTPLASGASAGGSETAAPAGAEGTNPATSGRPQNARRRLNNALRSAGRSGGRIGNREMRNIAERGGISVEDVRAQAERLNTRRGGAGRAQFEIGPRADRGERPVADKAQMQRERADRLRAKTDAMRGGGGQAPAARSEGRPARRGGAAGGGAPARAAQRPAPAARAAAPARPAARAGGGGNRGGGRRR